MEILVTGGAGYIGSHVCLELIEAGYNVTTIDNLSTGNKNLIPNNVDFLECDINNLSILDKLLKKKSFDALIHLAAFIKVEESIKNPEKYFKNNFRNSKILFDLCRDNNLNNIVFSSTAAVYGEINSKKPIKENSKIKAINPYGESKIKTENLLINNYKDYNYIILRYFNVAGSDPNMRSGLISDKPTHLIKIASEAAIGKRKDIIIFGNDYSTKDGSAIRDYIHVSDLANIHVKALEYLIKTKKSQIINCGYGKGYSVKEVIKKTKEIVKNDINVQIGKRRKGDAEFLVSDTTKLKEIINWNPRFNDLSYIIKTAIEWEKKLNDKKIS